MTYLDPIQPAKHPTIPSQAEENSPLQQTFILSQREAAAASPESLTVCGEEDPGEALEFLVTEDKDNQ